MAQVCIRYCALADASPFFKILLVPKLIVDCQSPGTDRITDTVRAQKLPS